MLSPPIEVADVVADVVGGDLKTWGMRDFRSDDSFPGAFRPRVVASIHENRFTKFCGSAGAAKLAAQMS
jgi:hypothetical protein